MFKKIIATGFLLLLNFSSFCFAENLSVDPMNLPKLTQFVNDFSGAFTGSQWSELNQIAKEYEKKTTNQILVVLFPKRNDKELADIWLKIFRDNQIGQKGKNNGLLLLIATEEKKIRIVTGYWLEGDIPDILARDIIEKDIRPAVNEGRIYDWVKNYYNRVMVALDTGEWKKVQEKQKKDFPENLLHDWFFFAFIFWLICGLIFAANLKMWINFLIMFVVMSFAF